MSSCSRKRKQPDDELNGQFKRPQTREVNEDDDGELLDRRRLLDRYISRSKIQNEYDLIDEGEDDPVETENVLDEVSKAQETATLKQYDGIKITPFNLEEEQEEGEYDDAGNFIFRKKNFKEINEDGEEEEDDNWADSINWSEIEKQEQAQKERSEQAKYTGPPSSSSVQSAKEASQSTKPIDMVKRSKADCYKQMLRIVRANETVQKTIRRLGNSIPKRQFSNKKKTRKIESESVSASEGKSKQDIEESKRKLDLMIELAHQLLEEGDIDIYQKSYEQLEEAIN